MKRTAVYPGSFDPITNGHLDIIKRTAKYFDEVYVAVLENPDKKNSLFTVQERLKLIERVTADIPNIKIQSFNGLLVDFMKRIDANIIIKGLRAPSDFEYEFQMAHMNFSLNPDIETFFLSTNNVYSQFKFKCGKTGGNVWRAYKGSCSR